MPDPASCLPRRERERLMRRQAMLAAARAVFAEKSFEAATIEEIAERAQFGKGTLYLYFEGGKNEMLQAILEEMLADLGACADRLLQAEASAYPDGRHALQAFFEDSLGYMLEHRDVFMVLVKESHRLEFGSRAAGNVDVGLEVLIDPLVNFFRRAIDRGELDAVDPVALTYVLLNGGRGYLAMLFSERNGRLVDDPRAEARRAAAFLVALCYDGFARR